MRDYQIHKSAGVLIDNKKLLVEKSFNKKSYLAPGGKIDQDETPKEALVRELMEEIQIKVEEKDLKEFGIFIRNASGQKHKLVKMEVYLVQKWEGNPTPSNEVEDIRWINSQIPSDIKVGSIFEQEIIPRLKKQNLID